MGQRNSASSSADCFAGLVPPCQEHGEHCPAHTSLAARHWHDKKQKTPRPISTALIEDAGFYFEIPTLAQRWATRKWNPAGLRGWGRRRCVAGFLHLSRLLHRGLAVRCGDFGFLLNAGFFRAAKEPDGTQSGGQSKRHETTHDKLLNSLMQHDVNRGPS